MDGAAGAEAEIRALVAAYCEATQKADTSALGEIFHPSSHLYASQEGVLTDWPRAEFFNVVGKRAPAEGPAEFEILSIDFAGPEMAAVKLELQLPIRRFTDYLNFLKIDGRWQVIAKICRVDDGPAI